MPTTSDKVALWFSVISCSLTGLLAVYAFVFVMRFSKFRWVQFMIFLCIIQNFDTALVAIGVYWEVTSFHQEHEPFLAYFCGITIFLFYFVSNTIYWLFGLKYWVISIEIPHLLKKQREREANEAKGIVDKSEQKPGRVCSETTYNVIMWVGILVNLGACAWTGVVRGKVDYTSANGPAPGPISKRLMQLFVLVTFLLCISAVFLADALRRLKRSLSQDNKLVVNQKTMCLHVTTLTIHTVILVVVQYITVYTFVHPSNKDDFILNMSRIVLFGSQCITQVIVIFLFVQFSKPQSLS